MVQGQKKKKSKFSENFERDWNFYTKNIGKFSFWGGDVIFEPEYDEKGLSPKEFFHKLDSLGMEKMKDKKCTEPKIVYEVLKFKKGLNFHIKQWCEGFEDCLMGFDEYVNFLEDVPDWVMDSFRKQLLRRYKENVGDSSNGRTPVFETGDCGSIPRSPSKL